MRSPRDKQWFVRVLGEGLFGPFSWMSVLYLRRLISDRLSKTATIASEDRLRKGEIETAKLFEV